MKKVLLLFFAILSVSIAASAKQGTAEKETFTGLTAHVQAPASFTADLTGWYVDLYEIIKNGSTSDSYPQLYLTSYGSRSGNCVKVNSTNYSDNPLMLIRKAKPGIVQFYLKLCYNPSVYKPENNPTYFPNSTAGIYKMSYNEATGTYSIVEQLCTIPNISELSNSKYTLISATLDEESYIAITVGATFLDDYSNIPLLPNTVSGTITNTNNETVSGATVELLKDGTMAYRTTSGDGGAYTFGETVADGTYTLHVTAEDYEEYTAVSTTTISDDTTLNATIEPIVLPTWSFGGQVTGDGGSAIGGLSVVLVDRKNNTFNAITNDAGKFEFSGVTEGDVTLTIHSETLGYKPFEEVYTVEQDKTDYTFELENYTLSGSVLEKGSDKAIEDAKVVLKQGDTEVSSVTTGADGTFSFGGLKEGDYTLTASADGFDTETSAISLNNGAEVDEQFELEMSVSTITGTVTRSDTGVALGSVEVKLLSGDAQVATATSEADNGRYTFTITGKFAEAGYTLQVAASEYYEEYLSEEAVTPTYGGSITQDIAISPVLQKYIVVIENENHEALLDSKVTIVKKVTKTIDSFEYLADLGDGEDAKPVLLANGWLDVLTQATTDKLMKGNTYKDGSGSLRTGDVMYPFTIVRSAKAGKVSIFAKKDGTSGYNIYLYEMTKNDDGTFSMGTQLKDSPTLSSVEWTEVSCTIDHDCYIGIRMTKVVVDYYVNDFGPEAQATTAPAYAAPALAAAADETPETIKIDKNLIDLKTITVTIPKVDNPGGEYTATATAPSATLKETGAEADVWDFTFGVDETHTSVFTGGTVTGVSDVSVDVAPDADAEYFTLQGVRVTNPHSGIYICRRGSATSKVLIR